MPRKIAAPKPPDPPRYHHGDLRAALIQATDAILSENGVEGFTLREAARRAGVSAAAPAYHFGSSAGLLSEVAALGFDQLAAHLEVDPEKGSPTQRLRQQGVGYVRFALSHPGRFQLMFRRDLLSAEHEGLKAAGDRAFGQLVSAIRSMHGIPADQPLSPGERAEVLAAWSLVHGFARLALDTELSHLHQGANNQELLETVLPRILESQWPDP
ncbi:TetR/AcrR family transcriptional regulator [Lysobacter niastensis]|uniref:TetR/AcrR family transcriptional regulator n=1 Tax=Lysobacter niastensis TaxID=380629 RepID=A0ABS0B6W8_9GAMM|nr:TetR/AcrR family transcriptional regulator [Lysobacter niastensis]MBF6023404.1 TetR/AcrR family transcriptional regulator [Lysobacter niastensis]